MKRGELELVTQSINVSLSLSAASALWLSHTRELHRSCWNLLHIPRARAHLPSQSWNRWKLWRFLTKVPRDRDASGQRQLGWYTHMNSSQVHDETLGARTSIVTCNGDELLRETVKNACHRWSPFLNPSLESSHELDHPETYGKEKLQAPHECFTTLDRPAKRQCKW